MDTEFLALEARVLDVIKTVYDPEVPVNIYELGLIYEIDVSEKGVAHILMTLTAPNCPVAESLPQEVKEKVAAIDGIKEAYVEMTFDPPWTKEMMSDEARLELGMM
jgi:FeS assembly SUF system protein